MEKLSEKIVQLHEEKFIFELFGLTPEEALEFEGEEGDELTGTADGGALLQRYTLIEEDRTCQSGWHSYSDEPCPKCGHVFCWECCGSTNIHEGGKYIPDFMLCPKCGHDVKS